MSAENMPIESVDGTQQVAPVNDITPESIQHLINIIRLKRTYSLTEQKQSELDKLTAGQSEVNFASNLRRILTIGAKSDGSFEMTEELEKMLNKALDGETDNLFDLIHGIGLRFQVLNDPDAFQTLLDKLSTEDPDLLTMVSETGIKAGVPPTEAQLKKLAALVNDEDNIKLRKHFKNAKLLKSQNKYSKAEKDNIVESIRLFADQKHSLNDMSIQTLIRLESEMDQTYQYLMSINKALSDTMRTIARNTRGG